MTAAKITPPLRLMLDILAWHSETQIMTAAERGALLALKMYVWRTGPLPDRDDALARIAGMDAKDWKKARKSLEPLFVVRHGEWQREDWTAELEAAYEAVNRASAAGKKAVTARWNRQKQRTDGYESNTNRMRDESESNTAGVLNNKGTVAPRSGQGKTPKPGTNDVQPGFESDVKIAEAALGIGGAA